MEAVAACNPILDLDLFPEYIRQWSPRGSFIRIAVRRGPDSDHYLRQADSADEGANDLPALRHFGEVGQ